MSTQLQPCGTKAARRRHLRHGETCTTCAPKTPELQPCGTPAAWRRHRKAGEPACEPCQTAFRAYDTELARQKGIRPREGIGAQALIENIIFLLNAGEGEHRILAATGYAGREQALRKRLERAKRNDLAAQIFRQWELAA